MPRLVAAAVLSPRGLLLVAGPGERSTFFLVGGAPVDGEAERACLERELRGALGVGARNAAELFEVSTTRSGPLGVFAATLDGEPAAGAGIAWWPERRELALDPVVRDVVVPRLRARGWLSGPGGERVERVPAGATDALRAAILRPGRGAAALVAPGDDTAAFFAVVGRGGAVGDAGGAVGDGAVGADAAAVAVGGAGDEVLATVNVRREPPSWDRDGAGWWRLRGMATVPAARGAGHASAVLWAALDHVDAVGGRLWCQARPAAVGLYTRAGFTPVGAPWEDPELGPHQTLERAATG